MPDTVKDTPARPLVADHFCGQMQPHDAHSWQTPPVYGSATFINTFQCAGLTTRVTPPGGRRA